MIPYAKAHACGNDFLIITEEAAEGFDKAQLAIRLCERNTGIGADGIEFFEWTGPLAGRIKLYNADGSVAEISGNGTRCVAAWMAEELDAQVDDVLTVETDAGPRACTLKEFRDREMDGPTWLVTTDMDVPEFEEQTVELADGTEIDGVFVSMGNPHFVILVDSIEEKEDLRQGATVDQMDFSIGERIWQDVGEEICFHADFPEQTNVEFVRVLGGRGGVVDQVALRIFERGVGPTSSSGTGTSATATAMIGVYGAGSPLDVVAPGGAQMVEWAGEGENLFLTGPATLICRGEAW